MSTMVATQPEASRQKIEVTPEELLSMPDGGHYELIDGELKERNGSVLSSIVAVNMSTSLKIHCAQTGAGDVLDSECGYRCSPWIPRRVRRADVSFIRKGRLTDEVLSEGDCSIPPDLAVEVISPNDLASELNLKIEEYLRAGVRLVWVVDPEVRTIEVYRCDGTTQRLRENERLSGEDVLVVFECQIASLFPKPGPAQTQTARSTEPSQAGST
ncbi:MAG: Uma2 family endonuclease [Isosphaeraceae bacterium]